MTDNNAIPTDPMEAVMEKLRSIMRLAQRAGTDGERQAAEMAAKRVADKYGIALETVEIGPDAGKTVKADDERMRVYRGCEFGLTSGIIRRHFAVQVLFNVNRRGQGYLSWFGTRINIEVAHYAFDILVRESQRGWRAARKEMIARYREEYPLMWDAPKPSKDSFMRGWFYIIDKKLTEHPLRNDLEQFEAEKSRLKLDFDRWHDVNECRDVKGRRHKLDHAAVVAGANAAQSVNLSRPCGDNGERTAQLGRTLMLERRSA